ncbi:hypothetical protein DFR86_07470 [Acidianus sulfidivorans JP7]|uniref:Uncharacterized protein n=1 Tax=Acidianus sulfidivorans JP7 TaxID=619593 RepID=A0A2U9IN21_9CREN|nr:hypothetical protein [Acidianus sulfidivorans]AWR97402.1 hypothetical protein DFR86_07470 [Acidianus sulfidivorans JP7]
MNGLVYKYDNYYIAGVMHVVPGYLQDVIIIYKNGNNWEFSIAEKFKSHDKTLNTIVDSVKFAVHEDDLKQAIDKLRRNGIKIEDVKSYPFPKKFLEGKKKIQAEFD